MSVLSREKWERIEEKKNLSGREALQAVKTYGYALRFVEEQTEEICLAAVKNDGSALQYVKDQTEAICLAAVKNHGYALMFVEERFLESEDEIVILNGQKYKLTKISGKVRLLVLEEEE